MAQTAVVLIQVLLGLGVLLARYLASNFEFNSVSLLSLPESRIESGTSMNEEQIQRLLGELKLIRRCALVVAAVFVVDC